MSTYESQDVTGMQSMDFEYNKDYRLAVYNTIYTYNSIENRENSAGSLALEADTTLLGPLNGLTMV